VSPSPRVALLSVYDKTGLVELAAGLRALGWTLVASGGTAAALAAAGIDHETVEAVTGSAELLSGRVKTLHPAIHAGILADRGRPEHLADLEAAGIRAVDLVVVNLYPFTSDPSVELIDVGGPTMVRAAAKNHAWVGVVTDPGDYPGLLAELREAGSLSSETRRRLAAEAFALTARYDAAVTAWLAGAVAGGDGRGRVARAVGPPPQEASDLLPERLELVLDRVEVLRYGENPHQVGARYRVGGGWWDGVTQLGGAALSYLNVLDAEAAWQLAHECTTSFGLVAAVVVKHASPCGVAVAESASAALEAALAADPVSAFGGIVAVTGVLDEGAASVLAGGPQVDVVVAPALAEQAAAVLSARRRSTRLLAAPPPKRSALEVRMLDGGALVQEADRVLDEPGTWRVVSTRQPSEAELADLRLAWLVAARTTSNAIVLARGGCTVGIGGGQPNRVGAAAIAVAQAGDRSVGSVAASDAFFPFADGLDALRAAGVTAVVQPGGSVRDGEVVEAAERAGMAMVHTGVRHFRH